MILGITGTRHGGTEEQLRTLTRVLEVLLPTEFHHGACVGIDLEAVRLVRQLPACRIVARPGQSRLGGENDLLASEALTLSDVVMPARTHFARNRDIVNIAYRLIACPFDLVLSSSGGTSYTVNYARKSGKLIYLCWPDGSLTAERGGVAVPHELGLG